LFALVGLTRLNTLWPPNRNMLQIQIDSNNLIRGPIIPFVCGFDHLKLQEILNIELKLITPSFINKSKKSDLLYHVYFQE